MLGATRTVGCASVNIALSRRYFGQKNESGESTLVPHARHPADKPAIAVHSVLDAAGTTHPADDDSDEIGPQSADPRGLRLPFFLAGLARFGRLGRILTISASCKMDGPQLSDQFEAGFDLLANSRPG
jgi:hypothetical protein